MYKMDGNMQEIEGMKIQFPDLNFSGLEEALKSGIVRGEGSDTLYFINDIFTNQLGKIGSEHADIQERYYDLALSYYTDLEQDIKEQDKALAGLGGVFQTLLHPTYLADKYCKDEGLTKQYKEAVNKVVDGLFELYKNNSDNLPLLINKADKLNEIYLDLFFDGTDFSDPKKVLNIFYEVRDKM